MSRKPQNFQWVGFTDEQLKDLDLLDHVGNNAWARNPQNVALMPDLIVRLDRSFGLTRIKEAMAAIGYSDRALHMLDRWHSKATPASSAADLRDNSIWQTAPHVGSARHPFVAEARWSPRR